MSEKVVAIQATMTGLQVVGVAAVLGSQADQKKVVVLAGHELQVESDLASDLPSCFLPSAAEQPSFAIAVEDPCQADRTSCLPSSYLGYHLGQPSSTTAIGIGAWQSDWLSAVPRGALG